MDQNFHDVMGDVPESAVAIPELSALSQQWPPGVLSHMASARTGRDAFGS